MEKFTTEEFKVDKFMPDKFMESSREKWRRGVGESDSGDRDVCSGIEKYGRKV
ncbi:UNVERIFIED_CONTAM: hypothetical protein Slati_2111900 [Sesamum latifolium]|uniref:Uncharacterized protein n=1 Tax=Sesamum latifolium TaxID=2727402 RepID=A0AAW2WPZ6_9LAMI